MAVRIGNVTVDTGDVAGAADFWQKVTGYEVASSDDSGVFLHDPDKRGPGLYLQLVPEPKVGKNRVHIDLATADVDAEVSRIEALGASQVQRHDGWVVMADTDGNQFCVCPE